MKSVKITLQKITASNNIRITAATTNYDIVTANQIIDDIIADDGFVESLSTEPESFELTTSADTVIVNPIAEVDTTNTFIELIRSANETYHNLQIVHWGAKSNKFTNIHEFSDELIDIVSSTIDTLGEWSMEFTGVIPDLLSYSYTSIDSKDGFDFDTAINALSVLIGNYIDTLEFYYPNVDHDIQSVMDNWIRDLKKHRNYFMQRMLAK